MTLGVKYIISVYFDNKVQEVDHLVDTLLQGVPG